MVDHHTHPADTHARNKRGRTAFTLIELLVVIGLIALLLTLVLSGLNRATKTARRAASQRSAAALAQAVDQFKKEFGFLPPLVHDGITVSADDDEYRPAVYLSGDSPKDGPVYQDPGAGFKTLVVWNDGLDFSFFRRRTGMGSDQIDLRNGTGWDDSSAWQDRRYSKYALAYYLTGVLDKDVDGVRGPGLARPIIDGTFLGVGYPVGSVRDKYEPFMDVDRRGARLVPEYVEQFEVLEHDPSGDADRSYEQVLDLYDTSTQRPNLFSIIDGFGKAFRYYRWEQGRFENGQLVIETELDLNIPPVLIDPVEYEKVHNDPANLSNADVNYIGNDSKLRDARYAIVSAGPDGLFGTEDIQTIADVLNAELPGDSVEEALLRRQVWADNAYEVGS